MLQVRQLSYQHRHCDLLGLTDSRPLNLMIDHFCFVCIVFSEVVNDHKECCKLLMRTPRYAIDMYSYLRL